MKKLFTLIIILLITTAVKAQLGGGTTGVVGKISGIVIDSITRKPLDYATVSIYRSGGRAPLNGVLTDEKGSFKLNEVKNGKWKIVVSFIGYPNKTIDPVVTTPEKPDFNMGTVFIAPSGKALKAVQITGQSNVIETKIDKLVYNAEKEIINSGNATDVLQKVPMVSVDINGNVSLRGDQNVKILINGKPSGAMSNNVADVLKAIPADQIKSVEVITSPSAKYDAEGSAGILNIITKKSNMSGVSASVSGGIGTRQNNGNLNFNINQNRLSITANFGGNFTWPQTSLITQRTYIDTSNVNSGSDATSKIGRYSGRGSGSVSYDFNNFNSFTSSIAVMKFGFTNDGTSSNFYTSPNVNQNYLGLSNGKTTSSNFDWNNDYVHKFKKEGHQIDIAGQWSHGTTDYNSLSLYSIVAQPDLQSYNKGSNNEYTLQADYTLPVNDKFKLEAGGKTIIRRIESEFDNYDGVSNNINTDNPNNFVYNARTSNNYNYGQNVYAGYVVGTFTLPKNYALQLGSRLENTQINGDPQNTTVSLQPFTQNYNTYIPTVAFTKTIKDQTLKLTFTKRIQRPSLQYLNPFVNTTSRQSYSQGNPQLSPEVTKLVEFTYTTFIKSSMINASVYYKNTNNLIESISQGNVDYNVILNTTPLTYLHNTLTTYRNIGTNNSWGASFFGSINPIKILTVRGNINAYTYKPDPTGSFTADQSQNGTYIQYNAFLMGSVSLTNGFQAESILILNSPRRTIQGPGQSFNLWIIGVKKQFMDKKASIGINSYDPFTENKTFNTDIASSHLVQSSHVVFPFRSFGLTFSYSFGKVSFADPNDPTQKKKKGVNNDDLKETESNNRN
ncbi:TonB-dependent receptor domain-containing protein [Mucilaginibacter paludis]|uniref:TonB-dependent receptor plug n=1 Tax=Mucilaginibacter paludis DSM 18603 TaxID=714943 RepID=H1YF00_9SPHI|nr:TonB-dependent receptor [Mucilaginibacter paludis]EHQ25253.1 TonB-dependent receptor plug [Mucilaginibacter paludis DSM 18603]